MTDNDRPREDARTIGTIISSITEDMSALVRGEIALAKAEVRESARAAGLGAALVAGAVSLLMMTTLFLLIAAAYGIAAAGVPVWAGFLIVAGILLLFALILGGAGAWYFKRVKGPERAMAQREATRRVLASVPERFKAANDRASGHTQDSSASATTTKATASADPTAR